MSREITFLFYHYGNIPEYLRNAIEQVRVFNPLSEIMLVTDEIGDVSMLAPFDVRHHEMKEFPSEELAVFRKTYRHISCFKERFERFVLERWFVTETIRKQRPDRTYIMQDSDVAVFGNAAELLPVVPDRPICLGSMNPHFTFVRGDISRFLGFILDFYANESLVNRSIEEHKLRKNSTVIFNQGEMQFLFDYHARQEDMVYYPTQTPAGFVDVNIHLAQGCDAMQLRRRVRKKVHWEIQNGRLVPHFLNNGIQTRAFLIHFQGPGKRVFWRFSGGTPSSRHLLCRWLNLLFQNRFLANLT